MWSINVLCIFSDSKERSAAEIFLRERNSVWFGSFLSLLESPQNSNRDVKVGLLTTKGTESLQDLHWRSPAVFPTRPECSLSRRWWGTLMQHTHWAKLRVCRQCGQWLTNTNWVGDSSLWYGLNGRPSSSPPVCHSVLHPPLWAPWKSSGPHTPVKLKLICHTEKWTTFSFFLGRWGVSLYGRHVAGQENHKLVSKGVWYIYHRRTTKVIKCWGFVCSTISQPKYFFLHSCAEVTTVL